MTLTLNINEPSKERFSRLLNLYRGNPEKLISAMLEFKINDLKKGIKNIKADIRFFEKKYGMDTTEFYSDFKAGKITDENDDFLQWAGEYEALLEFDNELKILQ